MHTALDCTADTASLTASLHPAITLCATSNLAYIGESILRQNSLVEKLKAMDRFGKAIDRFLGLKANDRCFWKAMYRFLVLEAINRCLVLLGSASD
jgi:hypothetical protein